MTYSANYKKGFTLVELLIVIGILATLATIAIVIINPVEIIKETKDSTRIQEIKNVDKAIRLGLLFNPALLSTSTTNIVYTSLPDVNGNINDNCNIDYPTLPYLSSPWEYRCNAILANLLKIDGTGWLPINFNSISGGAGLNKLPIDPNNTVTGNLYYTYSIGSSNNYSLSANLQSNKYLAQVANNDGGNATSSFETAPIAWTITTVPGDWLDANYRYRRKITIDETKVDSTLTDFPVLVKLTTSNFTFSNARTDGYDIRFTSSDGKTPLPYERERHTNPNAEYWVKIPTVSSSVNTDFYIYYGYASASNGEDVANVWDSGNKMVQHLRETSGTHYDSTSNGTNGTPQGGVTQNVTGKIYKADNFDGSTDYIDMGDVNSLDGQSYLTTSAWVRLNATNAYDQIIGKVDSGVSNGFLMGMDTDTYPWAVWVGVFNSGIGFYNITPSLNLTGSIGSWHLWTMVFDGTQTGNSNRLKFYYDGVPQVLDFYGGDIPALTSSVVSNLYIGKNTNQAPNAVIDEVRISNTARSASWIKADYNSGNDSLLSIGSEASF